MSAVLVRALRHCTVTAPGPSRLKGSTKAGEALTERPTLVHAPGSYFRAPARTAEMLCLQRLAEETTGPDYLRPLLAAALEAASSLEATRSVLSAHAAEVLARASGGLHAYCTVRSIAEAERIFTGNTEPVFRVDQVTASARLPRHYKWHAGAIIEIPVN